MNAPDPGLRPHLAVRVDDGVRTITLDRGEQYNALSTAMIAALDAALDAAAADPATRVVVVAASGKAFCAGHESQVMPVIFRWVMRQILFRLW